MNATANISLYAEIRSTIGAIHQTASALETELARHQIYGEREALLRAIEGSRDLATKVAALQMSLATCCERSRLTTTQPHLPPGKDQSSKVSGHTSMSHLHDVRPDQVQTAL